MDLRKSTRVVAVVTQGRHGPYIYAHSQWVTGYKISYSNSASSSSFQAIQNSDGSDLVSLLFEKKHFTYYLMHACIVARFWAPSSGRNIQNFNTELFRGQIMLQEGAKENFLFPDKNICFENSKHKKCSNTY